MLLTFLLICGVGGVGFGINSAVRRRRRLRRRMVLIADLFESAATATAVAPAAADQAGPKPPLVSMLETRFPLAGGMRAGVVAGVGCVPFAVLMPFMPSVTSVLLLFCPLLFFASFGFGAAAAALQQVTPNRMRAVVSALYLFLVNLIGIGLGPTVTALITDYVFANEQAVGFSMAITAGTGGLLGAVVLWLGLRPFREEATAQLRAAGTDR